MARRGLLVLALMGLLAAGVSAQVMSVSTYPSPSPSPATYPPTYPPPAVQPATVTVNTGYARFFGPLSAGCQVTYDPVATATTTLKGSLTSPNNTQAIVATCTDAFTGLPIPYEVSGSSPANNSFQVSSTTTISTAGSSWLPAGAAYHQLGFGNWSDALEHGDIFAMLRQGQISTAFGVLKVDLKFLGMSMLLSKGYLNATAGNGTATCKDTTSVQRAFANWITSRSMPFNSSNPTDVMAAIQSLGAAPCGFPAPAVNLVAGNIGSMMTGWSSVIDQVMGFHKWPAQDLAFMAHMASFLQTFDLATVGAISSTRQLMKMVDAAPIVPAEICSALGIPYSATTTAVKVVASGPLSNVAVTYLPFTSVFNSTLAATGSDGIVTVNGATMGIYTVPVGAIDTYLTKDPTNPVTTQMPFTAVLGFTPAGAAVLSPIGAIVLAMGLQKMGDGFAPNLIPDSNAYRAAYEAIGGTLPAGDYLTRNFTPGSGQHLAVNSIDNLVPTIPFLGGRFLKKSVTGVNLNRVSQLFFQQLVGKSSSAFITKDSIITIIKGVYNQVQSEMAAGVAVDSSATGYQMRRRLQQTADQLAALDTVFDSIASTISDSNTLMQNVLTSAQAAISAGTVPDQTLFIQLAQVASVQSTSLAAAIESVGDLVAAGDYTQAASQAQTVQTQYTGTALTDKVAAAPVNTAAIQSATTPPSTASPTGQSNSKVGLGIGLGLGLAALAACAVGAFFYIKSRRGAQAITPAAATAEGTERV